MYTVDKRHRDRRWATFVAAFPDMSERERQQMARRSMQQLFMLFVEVLFTTRKVRIDTVASVMELGNFDEVLRMLMQRKQRTDHAHRALRQLGSARLRRWRRLASRPPASPGRSTIRTSTTTARRARAHGPAHHRQEGRHRRSHHRARTERRRRLHRRPERRPERHVRRFLRPQGQHLQIDRACSRCSTRCRSSSVTRGG